MQINLLVSLILIVSLHHVACDGDFRIDVNKWQVIPVRKGFTSITITRLDSSFTSIVLQVTALHPVCLSTKRGCETYFSYSGKSVGVEQVLLEGRGRTVWYLSSNVSQRIFVYPKGYSSAPVVGACPKTRSHLTLNPNIQVNRSTFYNLLSFSYATLFVRHERKFLLSCNDTSYWPQLKYEVYVLPWNQRFQVTRPSFNSSSLHSLKQALYLATSMNVLSDGRMIHRETMKSLKKAEIRVFKRLGLDMILSVVVRLSDAAFTQTQEGFDDTGFYVTQNIFGCADDDSDCGIATEIWQMVLVGIFAVFGFLFAHLGRRFHRLNTFASGFAIGILLVFSLLSRYTNLKSELLISLSVIGGGLGLGTAVMLTFWRVKPDCKTSHIPLYLASSFLILAAVFFTPLGNERLWDNHSIFFGVFFGVLAALAFLVFLPFTKKVSVDFCTALMGTYFFLWGIMVIFLPGTVFPYLLLDAVCRIAIPDAHNALTIVWTDYADWAAFIAWPVLAVLFLLFNHYCSPSLDSTSRTVEAPEEPQQPTNWAQVDSWPPLPPDAYVSERTPLVPTAGQPVLRASNATAPPPYTDSMAFDGPPSYRP